MLDLIASLAVLTILEIILGVDNLVFIAVASSRLPKPKQKAARRWGLTLAWVTRLLLLLLAVWIIKLRVILFSLWGVDFFARDVLFVIGGLFLLIKGTREIHLEFEEAEGGGPKRTLSTFTSVVAQIAVLDIIFSLDSVMTAVGLTPHFWVMATAITIAIIIMVIASEPLSHFIQKHPTFKMLAFSFLLLIGMVLVADGFGYEIPRGYLYFAVSFSLFVEALNTWVRRRRQRQS